MKINGNPDGGGGGAAVWGGITGNINSQSDLMNKFDDYTTPNDFKTINNESIVGEGDIEVGGLTPEQEAAVDILTDSSEGILYTDVFGPDTIKKMPTSAPNISSNLKKMYHLSSGIYYVSGAELWKYNNNLMDFEKIAEFSEDIIRGLWEDNSGRIYEGRYYQLDIENNTKISKSVGQSIDNVNNTNRVNVIVTPTAVYVLSSSAWSGNKLYVFNEETQTVGSSKTISGTSAQASTTMACNFIYKGHILYVNGGSIYELTESEGNYSVSDVTGTYFTMPTDFTISEKYNIFVYDGILYYIYGYDTYVYNEDTSSWDSLTITGNEGQFTSSSFVCTDDYIIGGVPSEDGLYFINLGTDSVVTTSWKKVDEVAVDLSSDQIIKGNKSFTNVSADSISVGSNATLTGTDTYTGLELNNKPVATLNQCIYNERIVSPGTHLQQISSINPMTYDPEWSKFYVTPAGRLVTINDYRNVCSEYDSELNTWVDMYSVTNIISAGHRVYLNGGTELWVAKSGNVYKWNDTTSDFDWIIATADESNNIWAGNDSTLRLGTDYMLSYDSGTGEYSWVSALSTAPYTGEIYSYILNGSVFVMVQGDKNIYMWDEVYGTSTTVGELDSTPMGDGTYLAPVGYYLYYYHPNGTIHKVDVFAVNPSEFDVETSYFVGHAEWGNLPPILDYQGKYWTINQTGTSTAWMGYTYDMEYKAPAVPTINGTYVLKAVMDGGVVTYTWVEDVDAQAIQITNQILG